MPADAFFRIEWHGDQPVLPPEEAQHACRVLRKKPGDSVWGIDGTGTLVHAALDSSLADGSMRLQMLTRTYAPDKSSLSYRIQVIMPLLAHRERVEWMVEKATELGATHLTICRYDRSEPKGLNSSRLEKILWATLKQCQRTCLPQLNWVESLDSVVESIKCAGLQVFACTCEKVESKKLIRDLNICQYEKLCWVIGPEGDLTQREIDLLNQLGACWVDLGAIRLRAETAALQVVAYTKSELGY